MRDKIIVKCNDMTCYYYADDYNEHTKSILDKEIEDFKMFFGGTDEFGWQELTDLENVYEFFRSCQFIKNEMYERIHSIMVLTYCSFTDAYNSVRKEVQQ